MKGIGYLAELKSKCPVGNDLHIQHAGRVWAVEAVEASSCRLSLVGSDLAQSTENKSFSNIKITNYWYVPKKFVFGAATEDEDE